MGLLGSLVGGVAGGLGGLWGDKRPGIPPELGEIASEVLAMARDLPNSPAMLDAIRDNLHGYVAKYGKLPPPAMLREMAQQGRDIAVGDGDAAARRQEAIMRSGDGAEMASAEFGERQFGEARENYNQAERSRAEYNQRFAPIDRRISSDALSVGTPGEIDRRRQIAAQTGRGEHSNALAAAFDAASLRGAAPSAAALAADGNTAASADRIARRAYDAGEDERRFGITHAAGLAGVADNRYRRSFADANSAAQAAAGGINLTLAGARGAVDLERAGQGLRADQLRNLGGASQLGLGAWNADRTHLADQQNAAQLAFNAASASQRSKLDTAETRAGLYQKGHNNFANNYQRRQNNWEDRRDDKQTGLTSNRGLFDSVGSSIGSLLGF